MLPNGKVLIAGGDTVTDNATPELYDPATGQWSATGKMLDAQRSYTATPLDNGKVLFVQASSIVGPTRAQLYDPATGQFKATGSMLKRDSASSNAVLLKNGKVLVFNGGDSAELYDPATGKWSATGSLLAERISPAVTLLDSGLVLVTGGRKPLYKSSEAVSSAELYDPATGKFTATGSMTMARSSHTATRLANGQVLLTGGAGLYEPASTSAELYDPATGKFSATGDMKAARASTLATLLKNGQVLISGGYGAEVKGNIPFEASMEQYNPATGTFTRTATFKTARSEHTATLLGNGNVLIAGGMVADPQEGLKSLKSAALYVPAR